jgi:hypothetical protein
METKSSKQTLVWGGLLIFFGAIALLNQFLHFSPWTWVVILTLAGLAIIGIFLIDKSDWLLLIPAYVILAVAGLLTLTETGILRDEAVAVYVLTAVALPFLIVYLRDREHWWALIPAYVLLVVGIMIALIGVGILTELLIPAYVLGVISIPFFVVFLTNRKNWWALIPGGILIAISFSFLIVEDLLILIGAAALIIIGVVILIRSIRSPK